MDNPPFIIVPFTASFLWDVQFIQLFIYIYIYGRLLHNMEFPNEVKSETAKLVSVRVWPISIHVLFLVGEGCCNSGDQAKHIFLILSPTTANRNGCPCCNHFRTCPTNTGIFSLSLQNIFVKCVTLTRAASQPVVLIFSEWGALDQAQHTNCNIPLHGRPYPIPPIPLQGDPGSSSSVARIVRMLKALGPEPKKKPHELPMNENKGRCVSLVALQSFRYHQDHQRQLWASP